MNGYKIRKGDLIIAGPKAGVITKTTRRYLYYLLDQKICRVAKSTVWEAYDTKLNVTLSYGSLKRRRLQRKMRTLDLHGVKHAQAEEKIRVFFNFVEIPCKVITGKSEKMKEIVKDIVDQYDWCCHEENGWNTGTLVVTEK
jgi:hypothetical protein